METGDNKKIIGIILTYNCEALVENAYKKIPKGLLDSIICVDDGSTDGSVQAAERLGIPVFTHPHTGYGGNLFFGLKKAAQMGAEYMIELHGDGQYDFASVRPAIEKLRGGYDLILGNRYYDMLQPLRDGMDLIRYFGNIFLSTMGRLGLDIPARDLFPGFRAYSKKFLETLDFSKTSENYFFSFEIIAQARYYGLRIGQVPTRCDYKGAHTSMKLHKGIPAIFHTIRTIILYRLALHFNIKRGIFAPLKV